MRLNILALKLIVLLAIAIPSSLSAVEFGGGKFEYMSSKETNFLGFGFFTSNKRFDAEIEGFVAPEYFAGGSVDGYFGPNYRYFFVAFSGYFHFLRTDKMSLFAGGGIMPWLPKTYAFHVAAGMDFFITENWRIFYMFRYLDNNAADYRYPTGASVAFGFKYAFRLLNI